MQEIHISEDRKLIYGSPKIDKIVEEVELFAPTDVPVLITGESGTGKENIALLIHARSARKDKPFKAINCTAMSPQLIESELFGHEKGSFTGADRQRIGAFEQVDGGTLFLDEIGEMSPAFQAKLLRVLQDGQFTRVGGSETLVAKPRIIAATNRSIDEAFEKKELRPDLYYRLKGIEINAPPLRDRIIDIPLLAKYFAHKAAEKYKLKEPRFLESTLIDLRDHPWPGNVRELENTVTQAVIRANRMQGTITPAMLKLPQGAPALQPAAPPAPEPPAEPARLAFVPGGNSDIGAILSRNKDIYSVEISQKSGVTRGAIRSFLSAQPPVGTFEKLALYVRERDGDAMAFVNGVLDRLAEQKKGGPPPSASRQ